MKTPAPRAAAPHRAPLPGDARRGGRAAGQVRDAELSEARDALRDAAERAREATMQVSAACRGAAARVSSPACEGRGVRRGRRGGRYATETRS
jgi:hypothetical protein